MKRPQKKKQKKCSLLVKTKQSIHAYKQTCTAGDWLEAKNRLETINERNVCTLSYHLHKNNKKYIYTYRKSECCGKGIYNIFSIRLLYKKEDTSIMYIVYRKSQQEINVKWQDRQKGWEGEKKLRSMQYEKKNGKKVGAVGAIHVDVVKK